MKNMKFVLASALIIFAHTVQAKNMCAGLFSDNTFYQKFLFNKNLPTAEIDYGGKKVVAILANAKSYDELSRIQAESMGIAVIHQGDWRNDHGMLRLGGYFIDRDTPGARRQGETNTTGIAWASVKQYVDYASQRVGGYNRVEVLFDLNASEMKAAVTYQKMRRAGIVRPDFTFGGDNNPKHLNNRLADCGEICFSFSTGSAIYGQIRAIEQNLAKINITNPKEFIEQPKIKEYLDKTLNKLFEANLDQNALNPSFTEGQQGFTGILGGLFGKKDAKPTELQNLTTEDINWLIGYKASIDYYNLLSTLQIRNSNDFSNLSSPRAKAVVIYDASVSAERFLSKDYNSKGVFSTWYNKNAVPLNDGK